jgi:signal transduction histidine kinase
MTTDAAGPYPSPATADHTASGDSGVTARVLAEQHALRRVATLVARGVPAEELFAAVTMEVGRVLAAESAILVQLDSSEMGRLVGVWSADEDTTRLGMRLPLGGNNLVTLVARTHRSARTDDYLHASGPMGIEGRDRGTRSGVATPVTVEGRLWGTMIASTTSDTLLPADAEARLADFTDLLATAIANADSRAELAASRARIVAAADDARRQIERDLHDGAQQRLVSLSLELRAAQAAAEDQPIDVDELLTRLADGLSEVQTELREIARGIHPAILSDGGLGSALKTLARRSQVPVEIDLQPHDRLPAPIEVAAYYVVAEALTNAAKHGQPSVVRIEEAVKEGVLHISVTDDGPGGADPTRGSGLVGLRDRVEAVAGTLTINSPPGAGTTLQVQFPVDV